MATHFHASQGELAHDVQVHDKGAHQDPHGKTGSAAFAQMLGEQVAKSSPKSAFVEALGERPLSDGVSSSRVEGTPHASPIAEEQALPRAKQISSSTPSHTPGETASSRVPAHHFGQRGLAPSAAVGAVPKEGPHVPADMRPARDSARQARTDDSALAIEEHPTRPSMKSSQQQEAAISTIGRRAEYLHGSAVELEHAPYEPRPAAVTPPTVPIPDAKAQATGLEGRQLPPASPAPLSIESLGIATATGFKNPEISGTVDAASGYGSSASPSSRGPRREITQSRLATKDTGRAVGSRIRTPATESPFSPATTSPTLDAKVGVKRASVDSRGFPDRPSPGQNETSPRPHFMSNDHAAHGPILSNENAAHAPTIAKRSVAQAPTAKNTPPSPTNASDTPALVSEKASEDGVQDPIVSIPASSPPTPPSEPTIRHDVVARPFATAASPATPLSTHAGADPHRAPVTTHPSIAPSSDDAPHAEHLLPTRGSQEHASPTAHVRADQPQAAPRPHAETRPASASELPVPSQNLRASARPLVQVEAATEPSPARAHRTRSERAPLESVQSPQVLAIPTSSPNQATVSGDTADVRVTPTRRAAAPPQPTAPAAPQGGVVKEPSPRPSMGRANKAQEPEPDESHSLGGPPALDVVRPSLSDAAPGHVATVISVPVPANQAPAAPVVTPRRTASKTTVQVEPSPGKTRDRHADDDEPAEASSSPSTHAHTNALPSPSSSYASSDSRPAKPEARQSTDSRKGVEDPSQPSHAPAASGQPQAGKAESPPAVLPSDRPATFASGAVFLPANGAAHLAEPAPAPLLASERTKIFDRAIDDPGLSVNVMPHSAHLSITGDAGDLALHVRVRDGSADVNVSGTMAPLFHAKAPEMRAALAGEGLQLGSFATDQQGYSQGRQGQPEDAPKAANLQPSTPQPRTSTSAPEIPIADAHRIHVTA